MTNNRILRGLVLATLFGALVYAALLFFSDRHAVADALGGVDGWALLAVAGLTMVNYVARTVRFRYLVSKIGPTVRWKDAFYVQFSGMTMTVTPGKLGEVLKAVLLHEIAGVPVGRGIALVFSERLADLLAVLVLSLGGLILLDAGVWAFVVAVAATVAGTWLVSRERFHQVVLRRLQKQRATAKYHVHAESMLSTIHTTLKLEPLAWSVALSLLGWGAEGVAFFVALDALGFDGLGLGAAVAVYAVSTIVGALAMFPGGLGLTEGSMMGILLAAGATRDVAFSATMIIRLATLWLGVALGWAVFASRPRLMHDFLRGEETPPGGRRQKRC